MCDVKLLRGAARQTIEQAGKRLRSLGQFEFDSYCFCGEAMAVTWLPGKQFVFDSHCFEYQTIRIKVAQINVCLMFCTSKFVLGVVLPGRIIISKSRWYKSMCAYCFARSNLCEVMPGSSGTLTGAIVFVPGCSSDAIPLPFGRAGKQKL